MKEEETKLRNSIKTYVIQEILISGIGWVAGLTSVKLMSNFFTQKNWSNIWGLWSDKIIIDKSTYDFSEKLITVVTGFIVMKLINNLLIPVFIKKKDKTEK